MIFCVRASVWVCSNYSATCFTFNSQGMWIEKSFINSIAGMTSDQQSRFLGAPWHTHPSPASCNDGASLNKVIIPWIIILGISSFIYHLIQPIDEIKRLLALALPLNSVSIAYVKAESTQLHRKVCLMRYVLGNLVELLKICFPSFSTALPFYKQGAR